MRKIHENRTISIQPPSQQRSRVTNGKSHFVDGNQNSAWAGRWKDLLHLHSEDLGGAIHLSEAKKSPLRRVVSLEVELERMEAAWSAGGNPDLDLYSRASNTLHRLLAGLGLDRVARDVTPSLGQIIAAHAETAPATAPMKHAEKANGTSKTVAGRVTPAPTIPDVDLSEAFDPASWGATE